MTNINNTLVFIFLSILSTNSFAKEKLIVTSSSNVGRWIKIARIQNQNPISGSECSSFSGTVNVQTDYGQTGHQQYYAIFSFGSRGVIKPLLQEFGEAANRPVNDLSRIEWRIYTDIQGWHYLWFFQSNYSLFADFDYQDRCSTEYWTYEDPPADHTLVWSSLNGERQNTRQSNSLIVDGSLGIGTTNPGTYKLAVKGKIRAEEIKVETGWADYVFQDDYDLPTLDEVEKHIKNQGHLINIPSAEDVAKNGVQLGEMNKLLLEKIEELTLYLIEIKKQNDQQQKELEQNRMLWHELKVIKKQNELLYKRLEKLENE